ncbi:hypothetical protein L522_4624 [Bordetella bronchiseptica MBORD707]|nr:hypothetical protein L522_4624 [Bordetella bronchiseptica MBORD707]
MDAVVLLAGFSDGLAIPVGLGAERYAQGAGGEEARSAAQGWASGSCGRGSGHGRSGRARAGHDVVDA